MDDNERYINACHAMQSGVAFTMQTSKECEPKHLRVGVNSALCSHAALVRILIAKGFFTEAEYVKEQADEMEREVARYANSIDPAGKVNLA